MKRRIILCSFNLGYIEDNGTLTIFYGFLSLTLSPHLPLPSQTKTEQCNNSTTGKYYQKGCFERPRAIVGSLSDPQTQKRLLEYYRRQKEKELQKRFFFTWFEVDPIQVRSL